MDVEELEREQRLIYGQIDEVGKERTADKFEPIKDGIADCAGYLNSRYRIAWVLKEAYDDFDDKGNPTEGGWSLAEGFNRNPNNVYDSIKGAGRKTFYTMAYTTYAILNGMRCDDEDWIDKNPDIANTLKNIAIINTGKFPCYTRTSPSRLLKEYEYWKQVDLKQLEAYKPQIVIFGGTFDLYSEDLGLDGIIKNDGELNYALKDGVLYIKAYHPSQMTIKRDVYVDNIAALVEKNKENIK